ncbi:MAG: flotillin, partial [Rhodobacteraceae bacterium]|nr:flotillin [Paracoccaceae bacterium]
DLERARLAALPGIVAEMVKPAEKIRGISINHIGGPGATGAAGGGAGGPVEQTVNSILDMAVTLPAMRRIGEAVGMNLEGLMPEGKDKAARP